MFFLCLICFGFEFLFLVCFRVNQDKSKSGKIFKALFGLLFFLIKEFMVKGGVWQIHP
jgi:hypothetical protein